LNIGVTDTGSDGSVVWWWCLLWGLDQLQSLERSWIRSKGLLLWKVLIGADQTSAQRGEQQISGSARIRAYLF